MKYHHILYSAINSPFGIEVHCPDPTVFRSQLYAEIRQAKEDNNHDFDNISIHISPVTPQSALWLRKNIEQNPHHLPQSESQNGNDTTS
jgi:hypothetical protein